MDDLKKLLLSMPKIEMEEVLKKYKDKEPEPLNTMFKERLMQSPLIGKGNTRKQHYTQKVSKSVYVNTLFIAIVITNSAMQSPV